MNDMTISIFMKDVSDLKKKVHGLEEAVKAHLGGYDVFAAERAADQLAGEYYARELAALVERFLTLANREQAKIVPPPLPKVWDDEDEDEEDDMYLGPSARK